MIRRMSEEMEELVRKSKERTGEIADESNNQKQITTDTVQAFDRVDQIAGELLSISKGAAL